MDDRTRRQERVAYLTRMKPKTRRRVRWSGWRPNWEEIINGISFILVLLGLLILWTLADRLNRGEP